MRLHLVLAATLAASFVVGCSRQKSTSPPPKALASAGPMVKPVEPSHKATAAAPPTADPPPATATTASPPGEQQAPPKDTENPPEEPPDPYASVRAEWKCYPEQIEELLIPAVAACKQMHDELRRKATAVIRLGTYKLELDGNPELERLLSELLDKAKDAEPKAHAYLTASDSLLGGKGRMLAAVYEQLFQTDIPPETRTQLGDLIRWEGPSVEPGTIAEAVAGLEVKLLEHNVWGNELFGDLAVPVHALGKSVIKRRYLTKAFHNLLMTLPEPHRTDLLMQLAWSPEQEARLDREREQLKSISRTERGLPLVDLLIRRYGHRLSEEELQALVTDREKRFRALEQARRDTIEGCFHNMDVPGREALVALDEAAVTLQKILDGIRSKPVRWTPITGQLGGLDLLWPFLAGRLTEPGAVDLARGPVAQ